MLIGIDPGIKGALAFFYDDGRVVVLDLPIRAKKSGGNEVDPRVLQQMLRNYVPADEKGLVVMESSHAFMGGGGKRVGSMASQASLAATKAVVAAVCELSGMDIAYVTPQAWQAFFGIRKTEREDTKDQSLRIARQLYPDLRLTKTSGRPDAVLVGRYGVRHFA